MKAHVLRRLLAAYAILLVIACLVVRARAMLAPTPPGRRVVVASTWSGGKLSARTTRLDGEGATPSPSAAGEAHHVEEVAVAEAPLSLWKATFPLALVSGIDGLRAELDGRTAWVTTDDLLAAQAYDHAATFLDPSLGMGVDREIVLGILERSLGVAREQILDRATVTRVRFERRVVGAAPRKRITGANIDRDEVRRAISEAAQFLARSMDGQGRYRYTIDATSDATVGGYNWPRHAGTTYFMAQAAALLGDGMVQYAAVRAAHAMADELTRDCGENRCIAEGDEASVGASALALIAYAELLRTHTDDTLRPAAIELARFLRSQQRADGELMHFYDRVKKRPVDVQVMYYTGEAALALSRVHRVTGDAADLDAATRALANLSGKGWSFFGSRYYFAEEHWTCQAVADLWDRAPNDAALAFCLRWHEYQRRLQHEEGDSPFDADGSFGFSPLVTPRITPASSRGEAAVAALDVVKRSGDSKTAALLDDELRRALAFVMRSQLRPGPHHLFARPDVTRGGFPGSAVDYQLRIDYAQHAGSMMIRYLEITGPSLAQPLHE